MKILCSMFCYYNVVIFIAFWGTVKILQWKTRLYVRDDQSIELSSCGIDTVNKDNVVRFDIEGSWVVCFCFAILFLRHLSTILYGSLYDFNLILLLKHFLSNFVFCSQSKDAHRLKRFDIAWRVTLKNVDWWAPTPTSKSRITGLRLFLFCFVC